MGKNEESQLSEIPLSERCKQILLGGLLGDSSLTLQKNYKNARYQFRHSVTQEEYFWWKFNNLSEIALPTPKYSQPDGASKNPKVNFMSRALPALTKIYNIVSPNGSKEINESWLSYLNELALLVWWLDDGSLVKDGQAGMLCCEGFEPSQSEILQDYLQSKWDIKTSVIAINRKSTPGGIVYTKDVYYRLRLGNAELRKLFRLILPLLETPTMLNKFTFRYNDLNYHERWISTMKEALPQFYKEIEAISLEQKARISQRKGELK